MDKRSVCESKRKYELIAVEYEVSKNNSRHSDFYKCDVCEKYHIYTINKTVSEKRNRKFKNFDNETYMAMLHNKSRKGFKKRY